MKNMAHNLIFTSVLFAASITLSFGQEANAQNLRPLTANQADAVVLEQEQAKKQREAERLVNRVDFHVLESKAVKMGDRRLIMNRVVPPNIPQRAQPFAVNEVTEISEEWAEEMERRKAKPNRTLHLGGRVIDNEYTEIRWRYEGQEYVAYSNVNFNYLRGMVDLETEDTFYSVLLSIGNESTENIAERRRLAKAEGWEYPYQEIPQLPPFSSDRAEYVIFGDELELAKQDEILGPLDLLHVYYDQNKRQLHAEYRRTEALRKARERYEAAHPEEPEDTVINFWPIRGSAYQNSNR